MIAEAMEVHYYRTGRGRWAPRLTVEVQPAGSGEPALDVRDGVAHG